MRGKDARGFPGVTSQAWADVQRKTAAGEGSMLQSGGAHGRKAGRAWFVPYVYDSGTLQPHALAGLLCCKQQMWTYYQPL
jgi:hypothetical protein